MQIGTLHAGGGGAIMGRRARPGRKGTKAKHRKTSRVRNAASGRKSTPARRKPKATRLARELDEALEHQRVTSEVLRVISNSPTDSASTLGAIAESIAQLLGVTDAN